MSEFDAELRFFFPHKWITAIQSKFYHLQFKILIYGLVLFIQ